MTQEGTFNTYVGRSSPRIPHDPYAALRYRDFRRFLAGQFLASLGVQMQTVGLGWYLYERTSSALALGGVGLAQVLPIFLLTLPAGHLADHLTASACCRRRSSSPPPARSGSRRSPGLRARWRWSTQC